MPPQFHPIALLHKITVDTYYRDLSFRIAVWRRNNQDHNIQKLTLASWRLIHRADRHFRANVLELRRVLDLVGDRSVDEAMVSPRETKLISSTNNNPSIV